MLVVWLLQVPAALKLEAAKHRIRVLTWVNLLEESRGNPLTPTPAATNLVAAVVFGMSSWLKCFCWLGVNEPPFITHIII